jgi:hypothetical protein
MFDTTVRNVEHAWGESDYSRMAGRRRDIFAIPAIRRCDQVSDNLQIAFVPRHQIEHYPVSVASIIVVTETQASKQPIMTDNHIHFTGVCAKRLPVTTVEIGNSHLGQRDEPLSISFAQSLWEHWIAS